MAQPRGLWIPLEILSRRDLRHYDKIVYALVTYLDQYGGLIADHMRDWAQALGCDVDWLRSELQRLRSLGLVHCEKLAWRLGPDTSNPASKLPPLPSGVKPDSVSQHVAAVFDEATKTVKLYAVPQNGNQQHVPPPTK